LCCIASQNVVQVFALAQKSGRTVYNLVDRRVCKRFFLKQMGIGRKSWAKHRKRAKEGHTDPPIDFRTLRTGPRDRPASNSVNRFFKWIYDSEAETLPDFPDIRKEPDSSGDEALPSDSDSDDAEAGASIGGRPRRAKVYDLDGFMVEDKFLYIEGEAESAEEKKEVRWISHTSLRFLYRQYRLFASGLEQTIASLSCFWRCYRSSWAQVLRSRKTGQHAKCDSCEQLKAAVKNSKLRSDARAFQADYDQHQREQFADRRVYYSTRNVSENFFARPALGVLILKCTKADIRLAGLPEPPNGG
jgi:hypothetical protein